jgi:hypothetical protein
MEPESKNQTGKGTTGHKMKLTDRQRSDLKAIDQIRPVLKRLGLKLRGYGPGISAEGGFHRYIQFDGLEWE